MERASPLDELCITVSSKDAISGTYQKLSVDQDSVGKPICTNYNPKSTAASMEHRRCPSLLCQQS